MLILDSDHMSLLEWGGVASAPLRERLADVAPDEVATTIICYEEQIRGWMAYIARAKSTAQQLEFLPTVAETSGQLPANTGPGF